MNPFILPIILISISLEYNYASYSCKSPTGQEVDWFVVYKLPAIPHENVRIAQGKAYLYADGTSNGWNLLDHDITNSGSAIGHTVGQRFHDTEYDRFFFTYNDNCPRARRAYNYQNGHVNNVGHMKGMILFDHIRGFWLVHSVENFPILDNDEHRLFPDSEILYGQSFLCITLDTSYFVQHVAPLLHFSGANWCAGNQLDSLPDWIQGNSRDHVQAISQGRPYLRANLEDFFLRKSLISLNGYVFEAFFKHNSHDDEYKGKYTH